MEAKEVTASLFDYIRDLLDVGEDASFSDKVAFNRDLEGLLRVSDHGLFGYSVYKDRRSNWVDKTPMPFTVGYVTVVPAEKVFQEMFIPRRVS
jgi:hypothetical protein